MQVILYYGGHSSRSPISQKGGAPHEVGMQIEFYFISSGLCPQPLSSRNAWSSAGLLRNTNFALFQGVCGLRSWSRGRTKQFWKSGRSERSTLCLDWLAVSWMRLGLGKVAKKCVLCCTASGQMARSWLQTECAVCKVAKRCELFSL